MSMKANNILPDIIKTYVLTNNSTVSSKPSENKLRSWKVKCKIWENGILLKAF